MAVSKSKNSTENLGTLRGYTPGPWVYDSGCFYADCQLDENGMSYEAPIAEVLSGRPDDTKANAKLIKLAPDMFSDLRQIAAVVHHGGLIGYSDQLRCLNEIRRISLRWWDADECNRLQKVSSDGEQ
jgi:hypothetical protein